MTHHSGNPDDSIPNVVPTELQQLEAALQAKVISPELFATLTAQLHLDKAKAAHVAASTSTTSATEHTELPSLLSLFESPAAVPTALPTPIPLPVLVAARNAVESPQPLIATPLEPARTPPAQDQPVVHQPIAASSAPIVYAPLPEIEQTTPSRRNSLTTLMATLGGICLLCIGFYLYVNNSHPSENLTGLQPESTEETVALLTPKTEAAEIMVPETVRVASPSVAAIDTSTLVAVPAETDREEASTATLDTAEAVDAPTHVSSPDDATAVAILAPVPAAPEPSDDDATQKIRTVLADYYADLFAPPLNAENYFAPQVERLYIQQHLTPTQINATITQTFFPDNKKAVYQVESGTLRVSAPVQDGSRTATYNEACRLFRVSKGRYQRLRTQVRVKFDSDYRITFLRQEKLLENVFE